MDKIENYLGYINSEEFEKEFGKLNSENIVIKIKCVDEPDSIIKELFKNIGLWVTENNARIEMIINK